MSGNPAWETGYQKPGKHQREVLVSLLEALLRHKAAQLSHTYRGLRSIPYRLPDCCSSVHEYPRAQLSCLFGFPHHYFPWLVQSLLLQCFSVDLCLCFHQLLERVSLIAIREVTNLLLIAKTWCFSFSLPLLRDRHSISAMASSDLGNKKCTYYSFIYSQSDCCI